MIPALRMLRRHYPEAELHVLVASEAAPLLQRLDWIDRVWAFPRSRGKVRLSESMPQIKALRAVGFDRSVDFVGNDRGAILSRLVGAKERLGVAAPMGFRGRKLCYTTTIEELDLTRHESVRDAYVLSGWDVPFLKEELEIRLVPPEDDIVNDTPLPERSVICHLSTSQPKKEWSISNWAELYQRLRQDGHRTVFTTGPSEREQKLLADLRAISPGIDALPKLPSLEAFMTVMVQARLFISPDTAPLHLAAGVGAPTLGLFGPTASSRWAPIGEKHTALQGGPCPCSGHLDECDQPVRCIDTIALNEVYITAKAMLA